MCSAPGRTPGTDATREPATAPVPVRARLLRCSELPAASERLRSGWAADCRTAPLGGWAGSAVLSLTAAGFWVSGPRAEGLPAPVCCCCCLGSASACTLACLAMGCSGEQCCCWGCDWVVQAPDSSAQVRDPSTAHRCAWARVHDGAPAWTPCRASVVACSLQSGSAPLASLPAGWTAAATSCCRAFQVQACPAPSRVEAPSWPGRPPARSLRTCRRRGRTLAGGAVGENSSLLRHTGLRPGL